MKLLRFLAVVLCSVALVGCKVTLDDIKRELGLKDDELLLGSSYELDFGTVTVGKEKRLSLEVHGVSLAGIEIEQMVVEDGRDAFVITRNECTDEEDVDEGEEDVCTVEVAFVPKAVKEYEGRISIYGRVTAVGGSDVEEVGQVKLYGAGGEERLVVDPSSYDWGELAETEEGGFSGDAVTFTVSVGEGEYRISGLRFVGSGFVLVDDGCSGAVVSATSGCSFSVRPSITVEGEYEGVVRVVPAERGVVSPEVQLKAVAKHHPRVEVEPEQVDMVVALGENGGGAGEGYGVVTVRNVGFAPAVIEGVEMRGKDGDQFRASGCSGEELKQGKSCEVEVRGTFQREGVYEAAVVISIQDGDEVKVPVLARVQGQAQQAGDDEEEDAGGIQVKLTPGFYNFGTLEVGGSAEVEFSVVNEGGGEVEVSVEFESESSALSADGGGCGTLQAGASCEVKVTFRPQTTGSYVGTLRVTAVSGEEAVELTAGVYGEASLKTWPATWVGYTRIYSDTVQGIVEYVVVPAGVLEEMDLSGVQYRWSVEGGQILADSGSSVVVAYNEAGTYGAVVEIFGDSGRYAKLEFSGIQINPAQEFGLSVRDIVIGDEWSRAPTSVAFFVDPVNVPDGEVYAGTEYYLDGEKVADVSGSNVTLDIEEPGEHVVRIVGRTDKGSEAEAFAVVSLVEGVAPVCSVDVVSGDGKTELVLEADCTIEMGHVAEYFWYLNGSAIPVKGQRITVAQSDLEKGLYFVVLKACGDKGQCSEVVWYNN